MTPIAILRLFLTDLPGCEHSGCTRRATRGWVSHEPRYCEDHRSDGHSFRECGWAEAVREAERVVAEDDEAGLRRVCPGCHAVAPERCAPGCIDAEIEAERESESDADFDEYYEREGGT